MPRKPVHLKPAGARIERAGRDGIWEAIRTRRTFTVGDLEGDVRLSQCTIRDYLRGLIRAGYVQQIGLDTRRDGHLTETRHEFKAGVYELVNDIGVEAPRVRRDGSQVVQGQAREQMWRTMKILGTFDYKELAINASTDECRVKADDAKDYTRHLAKAGYLAIVKPGGARRATRYRFLASKNTGPRPPMVQRVKQVYDPNLDQVVWPTGGEA